EQLARDLRREAALEQAPEAAPVLARDVAEAVLYERLLDRQVEERLQEARREDDGRVVAPLFERQLAGADDRPEKPEHDRRVDPDRGERTANRKPAHEARV